MKKIESNGKTNSRIEKKERQHWIQKKKTLISPLLNIA